MEAVPEVVEADVSFAELERATRAVPRFRYLGSDEERHHFLDASRPRTLRIFLLSRKEWEPPKVLDREEELAYPVAFRDAKLTCLDPEKPETVDSDIWLGRAQ